MKRTTAMLSFVLAVMILLTSCANQNNASQLLCDPSDRHTYWFDSYDELKNALTEQGSEDYISLRAKKEKYGEVYQNTLSDFENGIAKVAVPKLNGRNIEFRNWGEGYGNIAFNTSELYRLPWIRSYYVVDGYQMDIEVSYLSAVKGVDIAHDKSYLEVQSILYPGAPAPDNYQQHNYKTIYEEKIRLADGTELLALVSEPSDRSRIYVSFHLDGVLVVLRAEKAVFTDSFWQSFSIDFELA